MINAFAELAGAAASGVDPQRAVSGHQLCVVDHSRRNGHFDPVDRHSGHRYEWDQETAGND